jgi:hypothetical protein
MKKMVQFASAIMGAVVLAGCSCTKMASSSSAGMMAEQSSRAMAEVRTDRMLIWKARLAMQVWNVSNAACRASTLAESQGGYVENKSDYGEESANLTLRVPAKTFMTALTGLETLGTVTYRTIEGEDVTEQYIDVEARLKNKVVLRDRLKQLLDKATDVKDILAIETELNRVQSDIDSMSGRIKLLQGQVNFATVTLSFQRKPILGPLGYLFKGLWWGVEKLFVIRE